MVSVSRSSRMPPMTVCFDRPVGLSMAVLQRDVSFRKTKERNNKIIITFCLGKEVQFLHHHIANTTIRSFLYFLVVPIRYVIMQQILVSGHGSQYNTQ